MAGAAEKDPYTSACSDDPNFATICSFIEKFGESCNIGLVPFDELQRMLENTTEVVPALAQIHIVLLRRVYKSINAEKWEKHLAKFGHSYDSQDAWEVERFGYKKAKIQTKLRLLKNLLESQFDFNTKFKNEVNKLPAEDLRRVPLGCDSEGQVYWYQVDTEANLRVYREDVDDDTWELVATSRVQLVELIDQLQSGIVKKNSPEEENGGEGELSPKEILLDTGKVSDPEAGSSGPEDVNEAYDEEDDDEGMAIDEDYQPADDMEVEEEPEKPPEKKNEDRERMNTFELGKAVRRMLDTPRSTYDTKTVLPEIKLEPQTIPVTESTVKESDSKEPIVADPEPEESVVKSELAPDPQVLPKEVKDVPEQVVKLTVESVPVPLVSILPQSEPAQKLDFQKEKSPLDSLLSFTDKMNAEHKMSNTSVANIKHRDITDVMKRMDAFEKLTEGEDPFKNGHSGPSMRKPDPCQRFESKISRSSKKPEKATCAPGSSLTPPRIPEALKREESVLKVEAGMTSEPNKETGITQKSDLSEKSGITVPVVEEKVAVTAASGGNHKESVTFDLRVGKDIFTAVSVVQEEENVKSESFHMVTAKAVPVGTEVVDDVRVIKENELKAVSVVEEKDAKAVSVEGEVSKAVAAEERVANRVATEERVAKPVATEERVAKAVAAVERVAKALATEGRVSKPVATEERFAKPVATDERVTNAVGVEEVTKAVATEERVAKAVAAVERVARPIATEERVTKAVTVEEIKKAVAVEEVTKAVATEERVTKAVTVEEIKKAVAVEEVTKAVAVEEVTKAAGVEEVTKPVAVEEVTKAVAVEEVTKGAAVEEVTKSVAVEEVTKAAAVEEGTKSVAVEKVTKAVAVEEVTKAVAVEEVTKAVAVEEVTKAVPVEEVTKTVVNEERVTKPVATEELVAKPVPTLEQVTKAVDVDERVPNAVAVDERVPKAVAVEEKLSKPVDAEEDVPKPVAAAEEDSQAVAVETEVPKAVTPEEEDIKAVTVVEQEYVSVTTWTAIEEKNVKPEVKIETDQKQEVSSKAESLQTEIVEEVVRKSTAWVTGSDADAPLQEESRTLETGNSSQSQPTALVDVGPAGNSQAAKVPNSTPDAEEKFVETEPESSIEIIQESLVLEESSAQATPTIVSQSEAAEVPFETEDPEPKSLSGLVGYAYSSSDDEDKSEDVVDLVALKLKSNTPQSSTDEASDPRKDAEPKTGSELSTAVSEGESKRENQSQAPSSEKLVPTPRKTAVRASSAPEAQVKGDEAPGSKRKAEDSSEATESSAKIVKVAEFNPIVGETIEEEMVIITGTGSGAELQGGNESPEVSPTTEPPATTEEPPVPETLETKSAGAAGEVESDKDNGEAGADSEDEPLSQTPTRKGRGRPKRTPGSGPGRRGRPRGGGGGRSRGTGRGTRDRSSSASLTPTRVSVKSEHEVMNGRLSTERPTRQSSRIAKIQEKEEEERRKLEEQRLAQLKAAQMKKKQKSLVQQDDEVQGSTNVKSPKARGRPVKSADSKYLPTPSASDSNSDFAEVYNVVAKKVGRKRKKNGAPKTLMKKGLNPWTHSSSEDEDEAVEEEEEFHDDHEEEEEDLVFRSDHEFSPESDLGEDDVEVSPSRHARTAKRSAEAVDKYAKTNCNKCNKGDHPEWILLCDSCDNGCHASCLRPQLWVIPEGQWFCPPCQHNMLISKMNENLTEYDKILKKHENEVLRKERIAFVGISLDNVIPSNTEEKAGAPKVHKKSRRRQISSDDEEDELMSRGRDNFIVDEEDDSLETNSEESEDEPMYKLRARRATKTFNFKEYDEMINSALRDGDDEYEPEENGKSELTEEPEVKPETAKPVEPPPKKQVSKGKVMPDELSDGDEEAVAEENEDNEPKKVAESEEEDPEKEKRLKELENQSHRKARRKLNDLDATSEEDSDDDFKGSDVDDDEDEDAEVQDDDDSEWSGDREADESDDSIARRGREGKKGKYGRKEKFLEIGSVRRSTRRARSRIVYDESDQDDDEDDPTPRWNSESEASESPSESEDDVTWGKKKKKKAAYNPPKSKMRTAFFLPQTSAKKGKSKSKARPSPKKKKRVDDEEVDRAWNKGGGKTKSAESEPADKRSTRGKKINFRDILDLESGESDDDGNIHPKRRRVVLSDSEDSEVPSSSKTLVAELSAANAKAAAKKAEVDEKKPKKKATPAEALTKNTASDSPAKIDFSDEKDLKPVPAPPYPPVQPQTFAKKSAPPPLPLPPRVNPPSTNLMMSEILASSPAPAPLPVKAPAAPLTKVPPAPLTKGKGKKKGGTAVVVTPTTAAAVAAAARSTPPPVLPSGLIVARAPAPIPASAATLQPGPLHQPHRGISSPPHQAHPLLPPSMPAEISRVPNPAYYPNPGMRFPWGSGPPPPPYSQGQRGPPPQSIGKPPPLNSAPYMSPQGPPRAGYPSPPPLRIPNPNVAPLQSFQQFKRDGPGPGPQMMYRMPPQGPPGRGPHPALLSHMQQSSPAHHDRFYTPYAPYGIPPPHTQAQPLYSAPQPQSFDYRPEEPFKDEPRTQAQAVPASASPVAAAPKEDASGGQNDGEFGGLVSYFSSQRGEDDLDT